MKETFLEIALACVVRGWHVFPCKPGTKEPMTLHAYKDASNDEAQIRAWWTRTPNANIAIATAASRLTVWDCDHGLGSYEGFQAFRAEHKIPETYTIRTGRRDDYGVQTYFADPDGIKSIGWGEGAHTGDIRSATGYVMAAGSIHPDTGERYEVLMDAPLAVTPDFVRKLKPRSLPNRLEERNEPITDDSGPIEEHRNVHMISLLGRKRAEGAEDDAILEYALDVNEKRMTPPLDEMELERLVQNACKYPIGEPDPVVLIGGKIADAPEEPKEPIDWRTRYMTEAAYLNVKPPEFLIDGFLVRKSIAMLAGPVAQRKSIIALNIAHALCTGEPLFGYFDVTVCPERVVYLCPEMGAASFVKRIKQIGLGKFMGKTLFVQTMSEKPTALDELDDELPGAVVIVDTITRFIEGDENKSEDMRKFAQKVFRLMNAGATVVLLHHSKKGSSGSLDDGLRGSSELAAFVDSCWVTELEDTTKPYETLSKMRNVKQRDFESDPFRLKPAPASYYLTMEGDPAPEAVIRSKKEAAARDALAVILKDSPKAGINKLRDALKAKGYGKGQKWITLARCEILGTGATLSSD
jgi:hypothetical protein